MADKATSPSLASIPKHSVLNSSFPVLLPEIDALFNLAVDVEPPTLAESISPPTGQLSVQEVTNDLKTLDTQDDTTLVADGQVPFISENHARNNKDLTENGDVTNVSSKNPLVDLFYNLSENTLDDKLDQTLTRAWSEDALLTLKIIFNARSIRLGKSSRLAAYRAFGWLANHHPATFLKNLHWLVRPVIEKKTSKPVEGESTADEEDFEMVASEDTTTMESAHVHDVRHGVSHGYWKDLLNLLVFAANDQLKVDGKFSSLLNQHPDKSTEGKRKRGQDQEAAKELRRKKVKEQNERVQEKLRCDPFYRALHVHVARLFATQLQIDKALLDSGKRSDLKKLSLAAKWAPTFGEFHDKQTFILSSIAELLFPEPAQHCPDPTNRELYLRHVRELFRKQYSSPLRKALGIVERDIAAENFENIEYNRVPSIAMDRYTTLFIRKDHEHFIKYVNDVSNGDASISGATLLPSTLVRKVCNLPTLKTRGRKKSRTQSNIAAEYQKIQRDVVDGQWRTLVESVRNAGILQSSVAVCDVSGSMFAPTFRDKSTPLHSAIGLSLLIAEITDGPFGGTIITFSEHPQSLKLENSERKSSGFCDTVDYVRTIDWGFNTDLVAVFQSLLANAERVNAAREEMVKQVFVFSDMQFDEGMDQDRWTSSYGRIKNAYAEAGYDMPKLIFWNLEGRTNKPVTVDDWNTALVSGYSQGMLKAFLETGALEGVEKVVEQVVEGEDGMVEVKKVEMVDPLTVVKKAVEHKAYGMLAVVD